MTQELRIEIDRSSPVPLYHQVASAIEAQIEDGTLQAGQFLENEVSLAARLRISRPTTRQAMQELVHKGRLVRRRGVGTQVVPERIHRPVELTSLHADLERAGRTPSTTVLSYERIKATSEVAATLDVDPGTEVVAVKRLRLADDEPLAVLTNYLPPQWAPDEDELGAQGLYQALRTRGIRPKVANQRIGARLATAAEARMLQESGRVAVLTMERTAFDESGRAVEHGSHIYRASRYMFDTSVVAR